MKEIHNSLYCINLAHREDRWKLFSKERQKFPESFNIVRFEAINDPIEPRTGCAKSHITLLEMAKKNNMQSILVVEDDVRFVEEPYTKIHAALANIPDDWDILLCGVYETPVGDKIEDNLYKIYYAQCTHCVVYNYSCYDTMIQYDGNPLGIDDYISYLAVTGEINLYHVHPPIAFQKSGFSDIKKAVFDWNNDHHLNKDYFYYKNVFESLRNKDLEGGKRNMEKIQDSYLKEQSSVMLNKMKHNFLK